MNENKTVQAAREALIQVSPQAAKIIMSLLKIIEHRDNTIEELRKELDADNPGMADK